MQAVAERMTGSERTAHRARSLIHNTEALAHPQTIGERIAACRKKLDLTQVQVAEMIHLTQQSDSRKDTSTKPGWTPKAAGQTRSLSRTAYIMYETDSVKPVLSVLEQIALALRTTPEYIAFGVGDPNPVEQVTYEPANDEFVRARTWSLDNDWLEERFQAEAHDLVLAAVNDFTPSLKPGDIAVVRREVEPTASRGEFVFGMDGELRAAIVTRPTRGGPYRVYGADKQTHTDVDPGDLHILGKVVGKIGEA